MPTSRIRNTHLRSEVGLSIILLAVFGVVAARTVHAQDDQRPGVNWAVLIGVSEYPSVWAPLKSCLADVKEFRSVLEAKYGYASTNIIELVDKDAHKLAITGTFGKRYLGSLVGPNDSLLIYFSGHGQIEKPLNGPVRSHLIPFLTEASSQDEYDVYVSMDELVAAAQRLPARHVFFILDSCYSGGILTKGDDPPDVSIEVKKNNPSWQALAASPINKKAQVDGGKQGMSLFTSALVEVLKGRGATPSGYLTASELSEEVKRRVRLNPIAKQHGQDPQSGRIRDDGKGGEFLFRTKGIYPPDTILNALSAHGSPRLRLAAADELINWVSKRPPFERLALEPTVATLLRDQAWKELTVSEPRLSSREKDDVAQQMLARLAVFGSTSGLKDIASVTSGISAAERIISLTESSSAIRLNLGPVIIDDYSSLSQKTGTVDKDEVHDQWISERNPLLIGDNVELAVRARLADNQADTTWQDRVAMERVVPGLQDDAELMPAFKKAYEDSRTRDNLFVLLTLFRLNPSAYITQLLDAYRDRNRTLDRKDWFADHRIPVLEKIELVGEKQLPTTSSLLNFLEGETLTQNRIVRAKAVDILLQRGIPAAALVLASTVSSGSSDLPPVALPKAGWAKLPVLQQIELVIPLLEYPSALVTRSVGKALASNGSQRALDALRSKLRKVPRSLDHLWLAVLLARRGDGEALRFCFDLFEQGFPDANRRRPPFYTVDLEYLDLADAALIVLKSPLGSKVTSNSLAWMLEPLDYRRYPRNDLWLALQQNFKGREGMLLDNLIKVDRLPSLKARWIGFLASIYPPAKLHLATMVKNAKSVLRKREIVRAALETGQCFDVETVRAAVSFDGFSYVAASLLDPACSAVSDRRARIIALIFRGLISDEKVVLSELEKLGVTEKTLGKAAELTDRHDEQLMLARLAIVTARAGELERSDKLFRTALELAMSRLAATQPDSDDEKVVRDGAFGVRDLRAFAFACNSMRKDHIGDEMRTRLLASMSNRLEQCTLILSASEKAAILNDESSAKQLFDQAAGLAPLGADTTLYARARLAKAALARRSEVIPCSTEWDPRYPSIDPLLSARLAVFESGCLPGTFACDLWNYPVVRARFAKWAEAYEPWAEKKQNLTALVGQDQSLIRQVALRNEVARLFMKR